MYRSGGSLVRHAGAIGIVIPQESGGFYRCAEERIPGGRGRPGEGDPRNAEAPSCPSAPFVEFCLVRVRHHSKALESCRQVLQFASFTNATHEGFPVDTDDSLQQACGRLYERTQDLFRGRKQTLQVGDGGRSLLAFDAERLVAADGLGTCSGGFLFDRRRERAKTPLSIASAPSSR